MLNLRENRVSLIKRAIESITEAEVVFDYEPSEIITAMFESSSSSVDPQHTDNGFRRRKLKELQESTEISFFPNSSSYIKKSQKIRDQND